MHKNLVDSVSLLKLQWRVCLYKYRRDFITMRGLLAKRQFVFDFFSFSAALLLANILLHLVPSRRALSKIEKLVKIENQVIHMQLYCPIL